MEKGKRLAAAQFQLPEAMIQHIQSFLNSKEAARTTLFSKAWYNAWLTRPNLDFDEDDFINKTGEDNETCSMRLWEYVNKVMQRYDELKLKIDSLRLWVYSSIDAKGCSYNELIVKSLKMGATSLDCEFHRSEEFGESYDLSDEVFRSENLVKLYLGGCEIFGREEKISCSRLKSLTLDDVSFELDDMMWKLFSRCPLIESLSLSDPNFEFITNLNVGSVVNMFRNLKCLTLYVGFCDDVMEISSPSLEYINFCCEPFYGDGDGDGDGDKILKAKFNVPKIRKFTFSGSTIPKLSFEATKSTWESHITIKRWYTPCSATWFCELNNLLKTLSLSKVSLSLDIFSDKRMDCVGEIPSLTKPEVESLAINGRCSVDPALFDCLFQCCRPIYITHCWFPKSNRDGNIITNDIVELVYKKMMHQVSLNSCFVYQRTSALCTIEVVCAEFYDEFVSAWRPRLLDTSTSLGDDEEGDEEGENKQKIRDYKQRIRLHLRWEH